MIILGKSIKLLKKKANLRLYQTSFIKCFEKKKAETTIINFWHSLTKIKLVFCQDFFHNTYNSQGFSGSWRLYFYFFFVVVVFFCFLFCGFYTIMNG